MRRLFGGLYTAQFGRLTEYTCCKECRDIRVRNAPVASVHFRSDRFQGLLIHRLYSPLDVVEIRTKLRV